MLTWACFAYARWTAAELWPRASRANRSGYGGIADPRPERDQDADVLLFRTDRIRFGGLDIEMDPVVVHRDGADVPEGGCRCRGGIVSKTQQIGVA